MNMQSLWVPGPLPGLNEILNAKGNNFRGGRSSWTGMKRIWNSCVSMMAMAQRLERMESAHFVYLWRELREQRDPSNFTSGGRKIIEDGLQVAGRVLDKDGKVVKKGMLPNDGWKQVLSFQDAWVVDKERAGVTVFMMDTKVYAPDEFWIEQEERRRNGK